MMTNTIRMWIDRKCLFLLILVSTQICASPLSDYGAINLTTANSFKFWTPLEISFSSKHQLVGNTADVFGVRIALLSGENRDINGLDIGIGELKSKNMSGLAIAGFMSKVGEFQDGESGNMTGFQFSFSAIASKLRGVQVGIIASSKELYGVQLGVLTDNHLLRGVQLAGISNIGYHYPSEVQGVQIGILNILTQLRGIQFGGFNASDNVSGLQLGLVNGCDSLVGVQIGLINYESQSNFKYLPVVRVRW